MPNVFKQKREEMNLRQGEIAKRIGVSRVTVNNWEMGKSFPRRRMHRKVAKVYGVDAQELARQSLAAGTLL